MGQHRLLVSNRRDSGAGATLSADQVQHLGGLRSANAVNGQPRIALEVPKGVRGQRPKDSIGSPAVESEVIQRCL